MLSCRRPRSSEQAHEPFITNALRKKLAANARHSVSEAENQRLYNIYVQYLDAKRSAATQLKLDHFVSSFMVLVFAVEFMEWLRELTAKTASTFKGT
ncbi:hypothetical protein Tco_1163187 [Tanacetum coccineum]